MTFYNPDLERGYRDSLVEASQKRMREATLSGIVLWLVGGVIAHRFVGADPRIAYTVTVSMALINLVGYFVVRQARSYIQLQVVGALANSIAILAFFWFTAALDRFDLLAALGAMLIATFSFVVMQLRFIISVIMATIYVSVFLAMSIGTGSSGTFPQTFVFASALVMGVLGVRQMEAESRTGFIQRVTIDALRGDVERLLRTYLSPRVAEKMIADPEVSNLGGEAASVSVVFADLEGFTPMSRTMTPEEVAAILNRYFEVVVPTVIAEGGAVLSFGGDAILAVFNAPDPQPDHALRAVRSALRIQEAVAGLRNEEGLQDAPLFRIGVNTGEAFIGNVGSDEARTFTVIGDAVNLASRLQTRATPGMVLVGPETYRSVMDLVEAEPVGELILKGISAPIGCYHVKAIRG